MTSSADLQRLWSEGASAYAASSHDGVGHLMLLNREIAQELVAKCQQTQENLLQILDVASGSGEPACTLAGLLPSAVVTATDYASGMVSEAKRRAQARNLTNMKFAVADAKDLKQYSSNTFDGLCCASGLQLLLPDHARAIQEFKRVLKPGGTLIVSVWGKPEQTNCANLMGHVTKQMLKPYEDGKNQSTAQPAPMLGDPKQLTATLEQGSFDHVQTRDFSCVFDMTVDELVSNPMMVNVFQRLRANGEDNGQEKVAAAVTELARDHGFLKPDGGLLFPTNLAVIATAVA